MTPEKGLKRPSTRSWEGQNLPPWCLDAVSSLGYAEPTPVQAATLPLFMGNSDVVVEAPTGSGKSIAFLLPLCAKLLKEETTKRHHVAALILTPTRELAMQIHSVLLSLLAFHPPSAEVLQLDTGEKRPATAEPIILPQLVTGGSTKPAEDLAYFLRQSPNVLIATPGRLVELVASPHVNSTSSFQMLVLDEADRLLDLGFSRELHRIIAFLPKQRRTGLFSASVSQALGEIIKVNLRNPRRVVVRVKSLKDNAVVEERRTPASLTMSYLIVPPEHKLPALAQLLEKLEPRPQRVIAFFASCFSVKYFAMVLPSILPQSYTVVPFHGKMEPPARERSFAKFTGSSSPSILLTTDIASRGLDIPAVDLVVNIDPPTDVKNFIHRCGRSGRNGRRGLAVTLLQPGREEDYVPFLAIRQTPISPLARPLVRVTAAEAETATRRLRAAAAADRAVFLLSQRAFPSWVRAYQEHRAASIFRVDDLDFAALARAWGLLRLPKMPELRRAGLDRALGLDLDLDAIPFRDKTKERKRQAERRAAAVEAGEGTAGAAEAAAAAERALRRRKNDEAWSGKHEREDVRAARREKKRRRREAEREARMTDGEKEEKRQLDEMVAEVRRRNEKAAAVAGATETKARDGPAITARADRGGGSPGDDGDAFEGFSD